MAVTNNPALKFNDQFLLNRVRKPVEETYKIPFDALAGNVLNFIKAVPIRMDLKNSLILIGDLGDVDVTK